MKKISFKNCDSYEEIERTIQNALKYETIVNDDEAAEEWFKNAGIDGEVFHRDIVSTRLTVWNEEYQGEEDFSVYVTEHYVDPGSSDYIYSYSID